MQLLDISVTDAIRKDLHAHALSNLIEPLEILRKKTIFSDAEIENF